MNEDTKLKARAAEKEDAMAAIWQALGGIEVERRHPDQWERLCLVRALQDVFSGCYSSALIEGRLSRLPQDQRSPAYGLPSESITEKVNLPLLFKAARVARDEPVRLLPHLGPIEIA